MCYCLKLNLGSFCHLMMNPTAVAATENVRGFFLLAQHFPCFQIDEVDSRARQTLDRLICVTSAREP